MPNLKLTILDKIGNILSAHSILNFSYMQSVLLTIENFPPLHPSLTGPPRDSGGNSSVSTV